MEVACHEASYKLSPLLTGNWKNNGGQNSRGRVVQLGVKVAHHVYGCPRFSQPSWQVKRRFRGNCVERAAEHLDTVDLLLAAGPT